MQCQLAKIYGVTGKSYTMRVEISPVQQQAGSTDCGLFTIAFETDLAFGMDPGAMELSKQDVHCEWFYLLQTSPSETATAERLCSLTRLGMWMLLPYHQQDKIGQKLFIEPSCTCMYMVVSDAL